MSEGPSNPEEPTKISRRKFLGWLGGAFIAGVAAKIGLDKLASSETAKNVGEGLKSIDQKDIEPMRSEAEDYARKYQQREANPNFKKPSTDK